MEGWARFLDTFFNRMVIERYLPAILKGVVVTIEIAAAVVVTGIAARACCSRSYAPSACSQSTR